MAESASARWGVFEALGDPVRRRILELLAEGDSSAGSLVELIHGQFGISQPATSQHLKVLRDVGLVTVSPTGRQRIYRLDRSGLGSVTDWLARLRTAFDQPLDALETELARGKHQRRQTDPSHADRGDAADPAQPEAVGR